MNALTVETLAAALDNEPNIDVLRQVLAVLGPDHTAQFLTQTLEVEVQGGMLVMNGTRRRTPGGVFFHLVRQQVTRSQQAPAPAQPQILTWDEVPTIIETLATQPG